jgi:hypothetical protein
MVENLEKISKSHSWAPIKPKSDDTAQKNEKRIL